MTSMPSSHVVNASEAKVLVGTYLLISVSDVVFPRRFACTVSHQSTFRGPILLWTATRHETHSVAEL
jgi:hypothetical protein